MPLLTDKSLREMLCLKLTDWQNTTPQDTKLYIGPFSEESLTPVGYDLRVGEFYSSTLRGGPFYLTQSNSNRPPIPVIIEPGDTVLIATREEIKMAKSKLVSAIILSKVSQVSKGLSHIATTIDPDWEGHLLIAVHNHSTKTIEIGFEEALCTVVFFENREASEKASQTASDRMNKFVLQLGSNARDAQLEKAKKKRNRIFLQSTLQITLSLLIILSSFGLGYSFFKSNKDNIGAFIGIAGLGVTLSQTALIIITNIFNNNKD